MDLFDMADSKTTAPADAQTDVLAEEIAQLRSRIAEHQDRYHRDDAPTVSDEEYDGMVLRHDAIVAERPDLADEESPTNNVGGELSPLLGKVVHEVPMLSLENAFSEEDVVEFDRRIRERLGIEGPISYTAEPKDDGLSCSLIYEKGELVRAATRGKGGIGEDITAQARAVSEIPHRLNAPHPERIEVRGEVYMTHASFDAINERFTREGRKPLANCRNGAAGAMRQQDAAETARRSLSFFAYAIAQNTDPMPGTQMGINRELERLGFVINPLAAEFSDVSDLIGYHERISRIRPTLGYDIDGIVYKVSDTSLQQTLGIVSRTPRWAIAHKFASTKVETELLAIDIQVGRTGKQTPVARLSPVQVGGVVVTNATLHNEDYIAEKDFRIGDRVVLQRAGDVIPQIVGLAPMDADAHEARARYEFPHVCAECGGDAVREPGEADRRCVAGLGCPAQRKERLIHLASKSALDIDGLGEKAIVELVDAGFVSEPADIFRLKNRAAEIAARDGWGQSSVSKMLAGIEAKRTSPLARFLYSFGVRHVGETATKALAKRYGTLDEVLNAGTTFCALRTARIAQAEADGDWGGNKKVRYDRARFEMELAREIATEIGIEGIGPEIVTSFLDFLDDEHNLRMVSDMASEMTLVSPQAASADSVVSGKTVVFTGSLEKMDRKAAEAHAESLGAKTSGSVSAKTSILVHGPGAGSKLAKAQSLGVQCMTEEEWFALVG